MSVQRLNWPTLTRRHSEWSWNIVSNTQIWTSPFNKSGQTLELPGTCWWCKVGYEKLQEDDWRKVEAWRAQLRGMSGRVLVSPLHAEYPRGVATGMPVVHGAGQSGCSLATSGWTPNTPYILLTGDYFSVATLSGPELKIITTDAESDASGRATLTFEPPLRSDPLDGAAITTTEPVCSMRLVDNSQGEMALSNPRYGAFTLELTEAWL